jgi:hypothetical protein
VVLGVYCLLPLERWDRIPPGEWIYGLLLFSASPFFVFVVSCVDEVLRRTDPPSKESNRMPLNKSDLRFELTSLRRICSVGVYRRFGGTCCLQLKQAEPLLPAAYFAIIKIEAVRSSETAVVLCRRTRRQNPDYALRL